MKLAFYSVAALLYTVTAAMLNLSIGSGFAPDTHLRIYALQCLCTALGLSVYPALISFKVILRRHRLVILCISFLAYVSLSVLIGHVTDITVVYICAAGISVCMGIAVGMSYVYLAAGMSTDPHIGLTVGLGGAIAIVAQYILQLFLALGGWLIIFTSAAYIYLIYYSCRENAGSESQPTGSSAIRVSKGLIIPVLVSTCCFIILAEYFNEQLTILFSAEDYFSSPRLLYAVGCLLIGILWDIRRINISPIVMIAMAVVAFLQPLFLTDPRFYLLDMCLFYLYLGVCVSYNTLCLMKVSDDTGAYYVSPLYRTCDNLLTGLFVLLGIGRISFVAITVIDSIVLITAIVCMWISGELWISRSHMEIDHAEVLDSDRIETFASRYGLTERETEVLTLLLTRDDKGDVMARELGVSRRGFVSFTTSIYHKTDTSSRVGLMQKYMSE